ncbi:MAG TPA: CRISPR-associated protein Csx19 [Ktedonobacteraceae bacterium]|nr:CRISPR-associated protein Csx19 [Ktedonobacteraceae bacterium]
MTDKIYAKPVEDIDELIASYQFPPDAYVLVEQLPTKVVLNTERQNLLLFTRFGDIEQYPRLSNYTSGRIFTLDFELRWERQKGMFHVVYIGAEWGQLLPVKETEINMASSRKAYYYLFGKRLNDVGENNDVARIGPPARAGDFAELRIPRLLRYPELPNAPRAQRLRLAVREYIDETGQVQLFRFLNLEPGEEES